MKLFKKLAMGTALAVAFMATAAQAADMKIALVAKSLGNGFLKLPIKAHRKQPRNWVALKLSIQVRLQPQLKVRSKSSIR